MLCTWVGSVGDYMACAVQLQEDTQPMVEIPPKQRQERQQMLAVLAGGGLEVSETLSHALSLWRGGRRGDWLPCDALPPKVSDPTAQVLYCYITEVKVRSSQTHIRTHVHYRHNATSPLPLHMHRPSCRVHAPKVYGVFLEALLQARELQWTAKQVS